MRRVSIASSCVVAIAAAGALAAAPAFAALPEINGPTSDEGPLSATSFTLKTVAKKVVKCAPTVGSLGGASAPKGVGMTLVMHGCAMGKTSCHLPELGAGEVVINITGDLGYISKAKKQVGADLEGGAPPLITSFDCGSEAVEVTGSVIARIGPVNTPTSTLRFVLSAREGVQKPKSLEGLSPDFPTATFGSAAAEEAGISLVATVSLHTPVTIAA
jgi:hypothetical protein